LEGAFIHNHILWTKVIEKQLEVAVVIVSEIQRDSFHQMAAGVFLDSLSNRRH